MKSPRLPWYDVLFLKMLVGIWRRREFDDYVHKTMQAEYYKITLDHNRAQFAALDITMEHGGADLFAADSPVRLTLGDGIDHLSGPRVGVSAAADRAWRFWLAECPAVSAYRRSPRAPRAGGGD
jgi:hypothetical protein